MRNARRVTADNQWFSAEIQDALDDPRPSLPLDEVAAAVDGEIDAVEREPSATRRRKGA